MAKIRVTNKAEYQAYLNSPKWQATRKRLYREYEYKCAMCGSPKNLQVHHITYENIGEEKDEDLTVLCQKCHKGLHAGESFFDHLCIAWDMAFETYENATNDVEKGTAKIQADIIDKAMRLVPYAEEIYLKKTGKEKEAE